MTCYEKLRNKLEKEHSDFKRLQSYFRAIDEAKDNDDLNRKIESYHQRRGR